MSTISDQKAALRRLTVERILALDPSRRAHEERGLLERLPALPGFSVAKTVLLYLSAFPEEIDTKPYLARCFALSRAVVLRASRDVRQDARCQVCPDLCAIQHSCPHLI